MKPEYSEQDNWFRSSKGFSREELREAAEIGSTQGKGHRLLINVTASHHSLAGRQFLVQQIAYWVTVLGVLVADLTEGGEMATHSGVSTSTWLIVSFVTWVVRAALFLPTYIASPATVARSVLLKLLPVFIVIIASGYWIWTLTLFVGPSITLRELFLCVGFLSISIAMTAMWPVTPIAVIIYNVVLWGALSISLYVRGAVQLPALMFFLLCILLILWIYVFISIQANAKLRQANDALEDLQEKTQRTLAMRSAFFAGASHDLKQRLYGTKLIIISARSALRNYPDLAQALTPLGQEIDSLEGFMGAILDHAKVESLSMDVKLRTVDIQSLFQNLDLQFERTARSKEVALSFRFTPIKIGSDAAMLHRILSNLISNALKFTRPHGKVLVNARKSAGSVLIQVWDQGPGIKPDAQERIFEAFHQEQPDATMENQGYGLGLSIVKNLSDSLGYKIRIKSKLGSGTCFTVCVPDGFQLN